MILVQMYNIFTLLNLFFFVFQNQGFDASLFLFFVDSLLD